jgi:uncharacterized membrane protein (DUF485 family)
MDPEPTRPQSSSHSNWDEIAASREFKDLLSVKKLFIVPAFIFFLLFYFALPVLVGYLPQVMSARVLGPLTFGYCFALSEFVMGGVVAWLYMKAAARFDKLSKDILDKTNSTPGGR